jgi:UDP-glucose 4-epimerase
VTKSILVTGGAGYVGSHATALLVEREHRVTVLDNFDTGHRDAIADGAELAAMDLDDKPALDQLFNEKSFDAVMHFAANSLVGDSMERPWAYLGDNVINAINLIRCAGEHGVRRFVLSSTANLFNSDTNTAIGEDAPINPPSPYGESKNIIERMLSWADRTQGMRSACLRYFNAAGAHPDGHIGEDHNPETHLIPLILQVALGQRDKITIFGDDYPTPDGTCIRDYVHVMDLAAAHLLALDALENGSCRYNLGTGTGHSVLEVIEKAREITGHPIPSEIAPRRAGDPAFLVASPEKIRQDLGWKPQHNLEMILETAWSWHKHHPNGYDG